MRYDMNRWWVRFLCMLLLMLTLVPVVAAHGSSPEGPDQPRRQHPPAPAREPVVLEREMQPGGALLTVVELPAEADTYLSSGRPFQNFGSEALYLGYNLVGENSFNAERILLRFDLASIPEEAVIDTARIRLHLNFSSPGDDAPMPTALRRRAVGRVFGYIGRDFCV
jgi:hypothetical protein